MRYHQYKHIKSTLTAGLEDADIFAEFVAGQRLRESMRLPQRRHKRKDQAVACWYIGLPFSS